MMGRKLIPYKILVPREMQVAHIGVSGGLHEESINEEAKQTILDTNELVPFHGKIGDKIYKLGMHQDRLQPHDTGYGGWGHPADQEHCIQLFEDSKKKKTWKQFLHIF